MENPFSLPGCKHHACRDCLVGRFGELEEKGDEPRCPVVGCLAGAYSESQVDNLLNSTGHVDYGFKSKGYTVTPSSPASGGDVLTIDDSSDEEGDDKGRANRLGRLELSSDSDSDVMVRSPKEVEARMRVRPSRKAVAGQGKLDLVESEEGGEPVKEDSGDDFKMGNVNDSASDSDDNAHAAAAKPGKMMILDHDFKSSTKLDALVASLKEARKADPKLKAVVFSQFTGFMDLVQRALNLDGFANVRLDGSLNQKQRAKVVAEFTTSRQPAVLVASLKAGGVGLNLIAATRVYIMDLWWNAAVESQAIDRIHRFGQTREVYVTRFLG